MNDLGNEVLAFFSDPATSWAIKATVAVFILALLGLVGMLLLAGLQWALAPWRRLKLRREWRALAAREGWASEFTRQFSGKQGLYPWRLAVLRSGTSAFGRSQNEANQALWQMRNVSKADRLFVVPKAEYQRKKRARLDESGAGDVENLAHFAGALAGLASGQSWAGAALGWSVAGEQHAEWVNENLPVIAVGGPAFQAAFVVLANRSKLAERLISAAAEAQLFKLFADAAIKPDQFLAVMVEGQFSMRCVGNLEQAELAARFSRLGLALTARLA